MQEIDLYRLLRTITEGGAKIIRTCPFLSFFVRIGAANYYNEAALSPMQDLRQNRS